MSQNRSHQPVPFRHIFHGCVSKVVVPSCSIASYRSRGSWDLQVLLLCGLWGMQIIWNIIVWRSYCLNIALSGYRHYADLSESIEHYCQIYSVKCVSKIKHFPSIIFYAIYGAVCFQFPIIILMTEIIIALQSSPKSETLTTSHCLGLGHETMVCVSCLAMVLWYTFVSYTV